MEPIDKLSTNFSFGDLTVTGLAEYQEKNRQMAQAYIPNLTLLAELLEMFREVLGVPLWINSGFRYHDLNAAIHGSPTSQHLVGCAADFVTLPRHNGSTPCRDLKDEVDALINFAMLRPKPIWHQLLLEHECIHVGLPTGERDGESALAKLVDGRWIKSNVYWTHTT